MEGTIAEIRMFAGNFAPRNWAFCAGQTIAIASNTALFSLLGTTYGGNGQTTFCLPDFRGRVAVGTGQGPGLPNVNLGEMAGTNTVTLSVGNLPAHNHSATVTVNVAVSNVGADSTSPNAAYLTDTQNDFYTTGAAAGLKLAGTTGTATIGFTGNNIPFSIEQPYLGMNYIICQYGIFPSRN